jgi:hypothetical protein
MAAHERGEAAKPETDLGVGLRAGSLGPRDDRLYERALASAVNPRRQLQSGVNARRSERRVGDDRGLIARPSSSAGRGDGAGSHRDAAVNGG